MPVKLHEIMEYMEVLAPLNISENWDNVGLLVGDSKADIKRILIALDVTDDVVNEAIEKKADLIISHHPVIFSKLNKITTDSPLTTRIISLIKNNINVYSSHTNMDIATGGTNDTLADIIDIRERENLCDYIDNEKKYSLGRTGFLNKPATLEELARLIKTKLNLDGIKYIGDKNKKITKVAIMTGSGGEIEYFNDAKKRGCEVIITSDVKYHNAQAALEMGLCIIDATHYATEVIIVPKIYKYLKNKFSNLEIIESSVNGQIMNFL